MMLNPHMPASVLMHGCMICTHTMARPYGTPTHRRRDDPPTSNGRPWALATVCLCLHDCFWGPCGTSVRVWLQKNSSMLATELLNRPPPAHQQHFFKRKPGEAAAGAGPAEAAADAGGMQTHAAETAATEAAAAGKAASQGSGQRQPGPQSIIPASDKATPAA